MYIYGGSRNRGFLQCFQLEFGRNSVTPESYGNPKPKNQGFWNFLSSNSKSASVRFSENGRYRVGKRHIERERERERERARERERERGG